jgi:hypothetical protein
MIGKYSAEKCVEELFKLDHMEVLGAFKILGIKLMKNDDEPKTFYEMLTEAINVIEKMGRTRRKNFLRLLRAANQDR